MPNICGEAQANLPANTERHVGGDPTFRNRNERGDTDGD